jgi:hypothetical protein
MRIEFDNRGLLSLFWEIKLLRVAHPVQCYTSKIWLRRWFERTSTQWSPYCHQGSETINCQLIFKNNKNQFLIAIITPSSNHNCNCFRSLIVMNTSQTTTCRLILKSTKRLRNLRSERSSYILSSFQTLWKAKEVTLRYIWLLWSFLLFVFSPWWGEEDYRTVQISGKGDLGALWQVLLSFW